MLTMLYAIIFIDSILWKIVCSTEINPNTVVRQDHLSRIIYQVCYYNVQLQIFLKKLLQLAITQCFHGRPS
ncbi:hypothetical protein M758_2G236800 [Ceratodon purpureus]|nr:hypothetical protein M758_2G236800 [Ceratodon purpureus]